VEAPERRLVWLSLSRIPGFVGSGVAAHLRSRPPEAPGTGLKRLFADPGSLGEAADFASLANLAGLGLASAREEAARASAACGARLLDLEDADYPEALRALPDAPPVLYLRGALEAADARAVAVVGSRRATSYGLAVTRRVVVGLTQRGVTVVSGMAQGIDAAAHRAALDGGGRTVAVLGTGIDVPYPGSSTGLWREIPGRGAVVSEAPPGFPAEPWVFPVRNRIVAGLTRAVVVVEATERSGSLITARLALEQGREVGAVPGDVDLARSKGANGLLARGAFPVRSAEDVLERVFGEVAAALPPPPAETLALDPASREILGGLSAEPASVDALSGRVSMPIGRLLAGLSALVRAGLAQRDERGRYAKSA